MGRIIIFGIILFLTIESIAYSQSASSQKTLERAIVTQSDSVPLFEETDVFVGGQDDINTYRIPSIICTKKGTVLIFCEGRRDKSQDGSIGIIYETGNYNNDITEYYARLSFARFNLEWLTNGNDHFSPIH